MKTAEQLRAANALSRIDELGRESHGFKRRYQAYLDRLCPTIVMIGLGQALATERAAAGPEPKSDEQRAHRELYAGLERWLCRPEDGVYPQAEDLLAAIIANDEDRYLRAQAEALAWLEWHKKFCRASFPKGEED